MQIIVNDASIIIDILAIDMFACFLKLEIEKHISSFVLDEIEEGINCELLKAINNNKMNKDPCTEGLSTIGKLKRQFPALSWPDCSCLYLSQKTNAILLTGEKKMTSIAKSKRIEAHGILWLLDILIENKIIDSSTAYEKLRHLMSINKRLPREECEKRLTLWKRHFTIN